MAHDWKGRGEGNLSGSSVNVCSAKGTLFHQVCWTEGQDHMEVTIWPMISRKA